MFSFHKIKPEKVKNGRIHPLRDAVANDGNVQDLGTFVILPTTFKGSLKHIHKYTQDTMTYVRTDGKQGLEASEIHRRYNNESCIRDIKVLGVHN